MIKTSDYSYELPSELIAQTPIEPRDASRLMVVNRTAQSISNRTFRNLPSFLRKGDVLVFNDSRVIPARFHGRRVPSGGEVEVLLLHRVAERQWEAMVRPGRRLQIGAQFALERDGTSVQGTVIAESSTGTRTISLESEDALAAIGEVPLPPYIHEPLADPERYQTVYARAEGSAAAPTAGLHFTPRILAELAEMGVRLAFLTLHVGLGTFQPVRTDDPAEHLIGAEYFSFPEEASRAIQDAKAEGGRVVCVGTTALRTAEQAAITCGVGEDDQGIEALHGCSGWTELFILPGSKFRIADAMVTNFHLPESTLLMLVSAFAGKGLIDQAYAEAVKERYRFYSFGDAMLIL